MSEHGIGASPRRVGGAARVTGLQEYVADQRLPGELEARLVTLDCARARIISIDADAARALPGVRLVLTAADLPQPVPRFGPQFEDRPVIADGETKYHGEPVALVAAESKDAAEEAARLVHVEYEELAPVFTLAGALDPASPLVQDPALRSKSPLAHTNVLNEHRVGWGDVDAMPADLVVENTYTFPMVTHFAIEPHAYAAAPDGDGIAVWSTIQHPNWLQKTVAKLVGLPLSKVRVYSPDPGGGFGGKQHAKLEPLVAFAALRAGRPVRLTLSLEQTFQAVRRAACEVRVRTGFQRNGQLAFQDIRADYLIGAYADIADRVVGKGSYPAAGPYNVPAVRILARSILSHTTPSTAFRGFGNPQVNWAVESNIDAGARALGIDRLEIRLRNLARKGDAFIPFDTPADGEWEQTVRKAAALIGWDTPLPPGRGRGIAVGIKSGPTTGLSYSTVRLLADGSVIVFAGTSDMGQGARTVFAQIAATELGAPLDWVTVVMGDTAIVPYDQQTSASRSTVLMGNAVLLACRSIQAQVAAMAARLHGLDVALVTVDRGVVHLPDRDLPIVEVLRPGLGRLGGELTGNGEMRKEADPAHPLGGAPAFFELNCTAIEAEVDEDTGDITIVRHVTVSDVGKAINPLQVRMQDEGAAIMGLGHTLMEHYIYDEKGRIRNLGAIDYRIPTSMDLPLELISETVENADGPGPYGSKGMSEGALLCVAAAVGAAVREATGAEIRDLPLTPERVWRALRDRPAPVAAGEQPMSEHPEIGRIGGLGPEQVVAAARLVRQGRTYSLSETRFPGMPLFPGHPPFQVLNYRTPRGIRVSGAQPWGPVNDAGLGYMAEYLMATSHSGAHIDALAHMTVADDMHWYGGGNADEHLSDFGPTFGDASKMPPFFSRGILLDAAGFRGVECLPKGSPIDAAEMDAMCAAEGVTVQPWDVVVIRTGYMGLWPDAARMADHKTPGPDISAARWMLERGVIATGTDTETCEVQPAPDPGPTGNPQPVHTALLIENGVYIMESLYLEELARDRVYEFLFVALPVKIRGATASMVDPLAVI